MKIQAILVRGDQILFYFDFAALFNRLSHSDLVDQPEWCSIPRVLALLKERFAIEPRACRDLDVYRATEMMPVQDVLRRNREALGAIELDASFALHANIKRFFKGEMPESELSEYEQRFARVVRAIFSGDLTRIDCRDLTEDGRRMHLELTTLLKRRRRETGYSIAIVAESTGIAISRIQCMEDGLVFPTYCELTKFAACLGFNVSEEFRRLLGDLSPKSAAMMCRATEK